MSNGIKGRMGEYLARLHIQQHVEQAADIALQIGDRELEHALKLLLHTNGKECDDLQARAYSDFRPKRFATMKVVAPKGSPNRQAKTS